MPHNVLEREPSPMNERIEINPAIHFGKPVIRGTRVPVTRIAEIVNQRRGITADTAFRLARYFKTTPQFWMNMQLKYELDVAEKRGIRRFQQYLKEMGLVDGCHDLRYVG